MALDVVGCYVPKHNIKTSHLKKSRFPFMWELSPKTDDGRDMTSELDRKFLKIVDSQELKTIVHGSIDFPAGCVVSLSLPFCLDGHGSAHHSGLCISPGEDGALGMINPAGYQRSPRGI